MSSFIRGATTQCTVRVAGFASKGTPKWRKASYWPPSRPAAHGSACSSAHAVRQYSSRLLTCPACSNTCETAHMQLREDQGIRGIWCKVCRKQKRAVNWACQCGTPWQLCSIHCLDPLVPSIARFKRPADSIAADHGELKPMARPEPRQVRRRISTKSTPLRRVAEEGSDFRSGATLSATTCPTLAARFPHLARDCG